MKTKIINLCVVAYLLFATRLTAQSLNWGVVGDVSTSTVKISDIKNSFTNTMQGKNILSYEGGLFARVNFDPFYFKPMLMLNYQQGTLNFSDNEGITKTSNFKNGKLLVPLLFGIKIIGPLRVEVGPVYNWIFYQQNDKNNDINMQKSGLGYRIGANAEVWRLNLGLAYQGLTNMSSGYSTSTFQSPNELIFSLSFRLSK